MHVMDWHNASLQGSALFRHEYQQTRFQVGHFSGHNRATSGLKIFPKNHLGK